MIINEMPIAKYYQLKLLIMNNIKEGIWPPDTQLPSENELSKNFKVSRVTVRRAIDEIVRDGYVKRIQGKGTYVIDKVIDHRLSNFYSFRNELEKKGVEVKHKMLAFNVIEATSQIAKNLQLNKGDKVFAIERMLLADSIIYTKEVSYIPYQLCEGLTKGDIEENGLYRSLNKHGIIPSRAVDTLGAFNIDGADAEIMQMKKRDACFYLTRKAYWGDDQIEYNNCIVRGDLFIYSVELFDR